MPDPTMPVGHRSEGANVEAIRALSMVSIANVERVLRGPASSRRRQSQTVIRPPRHTDACSGSGLLRVEAHAEIGTAAPSAYAFYRVRRLNDVFPERSLWVR
ncbi:MAG: hypothetical protein KDA75_19460 [Planctomycetaceae bacterium]|nr:hypothetical protein [Planctomycetaceae bacterium]